MYVRNLECGLEHVADGMLSVDKFRKVINSGYVRLPILLKDPDPEVAQIAWILSKYFSQRNDIMPEGVIE
jgi:hypothetical protein